MDEKHLEMAGEISAEEVTAGIIQAGIRQVKPKDYDGKCEECGQVVDPRRIEIGYYNCVPCQEQEEARRKGRFRLG